MRLGGSITKPEGNLSPIVRVNLLITCKWDSLSPHLLTFYLQMEMKEIDKTQKLNREHHYSAILCLSWHLSSLFVNSKARNFARNLLRLVKSWGSIGQDLLSLGQVLTKTWQVFKLEIRRDQY